ncbi:Nitrogen assimilation transcription factor nit-4 [Colletotrichum orbiculare MAFF 240422]|uniref:Nitrogen assimilation transcription factor nit-4 n=1 Tax=Colletotrichum orbiculare (strain 104-T / ATCC 96160 / CBS 514.97 / LARS 414 / MAFF 240422) TaxID=1213857 RepID=A0A484F8U4_COLOR|nr:Nitrogen assimilation transcription factor nit-4 [Colletotrichum orbiculare MAFF 240422]
MPFFRNRWDELGIPMRSSTSLSWRRGVSSPTPAPDHIYPVAPDSDTRQPVPEFPSPRVPRDDGLWSRSRALSLRGPVKYGWRLQADPASIPAACLQCRKRKVKCSGTRPTCWRCSTQDLACEWDTDPDTSRVGSIRRRKDELERENQDLHEFLRYLYARPEEEAVEIFKRLRMSGDALQVLEFVRSGDLLLQGRPAEQSASPGDSAMANSDGDGDVRAAGLTVPASPWTTLANDGVVSELMASFFAWDEPFYLAFVDRESFLEDMRHASAETAEFCSPALVNAICALRSALLILHVSAAADGTDRAGRLFLLAAHDMAQRLVLPAVGGSEGQQRRRRVYSKALWGMYTFESIFAFMYLRPSLFARPSMLRLFLDDVPSDSREDGTQSR